MPSAGVRLFVYGSLKRGGRHHDELVGARFLGPAETEPGYQLEQLGEYPALVPVPNPSTVSGELFEVDESLLAALDAFEGDAYHRAEVRVRTLFLLGQLPERLPGQDVPQDRAQTERDFRRGAFALAYLKKAR